MININDSPASNPACALCKTTTAASSFNHLALHHMNSELDYRGMQNVPCPRHPYTTFVALV